MHKYFDADLAKKYPNKYNLTPKNIKTIKVLDWDRLKKKTWFNDAIYHSNKKKVWCHLEGCSITNKYEDEDEFWIGFDEDGSVDCNFSCYEGMCHYNFKKFYDIMEIENKYDMGVQVNAIRWLNMMIDDGIISRPEVKNVKN